MYERTYGYRYDETERLSVTEIARRIREDIKQAKSEGILPARWTYSVTSDHRGGSSIDVVVRDCADAFAAPGECVGFSYCTSGYHDRQCPANPRRLTDEAEAARMTLERIHGAYNHTGSYIQTDYFDVNYYGQVRFEDTQSAAWRKREAERKAARRTNTEGAQVLGKVKVYGSKGKRTVHVLVELVDGSKRLSCGATLWRTSLYSAVDAETALTCSRCQKRHP